MKKKVLVTGGSRGIGVAIVTLLKGNYDIIAPTRSELNLADKISIEKFCAENKNLPRLTAKKDFLRRKIKNKNSWEIKREVGAFLFLSYLIIYFVGVFY